MLIVLHSLLPSTEANISSWPPSDHPLPWAKVIINVGSVLGFLPAPYMGLHCASKHAIEGMSETLDHEVRNFGFRVVLVEPTFGPGRYTLPQAAQPAAA